MARVDIHRLAEGWAKDRPDMQDKNHSEKVAAFIKETHKNNLTRHATKNIIKSEGNGNEDIKGRGNQAIAAVQGNGQGGDGQRGSDGEGLLPTIDGRGIDRQHNGGDADNSAIQGGGPSLLGDILLKALRDNGIEPLKVKSATSADFFNSLEKMKATHSHGAFVAQYTEAEYRKMTTITTEDGTAGIAVKSNGDIVSVFNSSKQNRKVLETLMPIALSNGGCKLDNFGSKKLNDSYTKFGFIPISKCKFNRDFAPSDWNYGRDGEPDIIFWAHNGDSVEDVIRKRDSYTVNMDGVKEFSDYEAAEQARDAFIKMKYSR